MAFFPFFTDIKDKNCIVAGGGTVALRKVKNLMPYGPNITVIAPEIHPDIKGYEVTVKERDFADDDITEGTDFVVAASDDPEVNKRICRLCREKEIPVNAADDPKACTFFFPALIKEGDLTIGISTSGASPAAASWIKGRIAETLPDNMSGILDRLKREREYAKENITDEDERRTYLEDLFSRLLDEDGKFAEGHTHDIRQEGGSVTLVGAGCGTVDWLTVQGAEAIRSCDVLVYDDLIDDTLPELAPESAEKIYAGKRGHHTSEDQDNINDILVSRAKRGKRVVRLKGGDPFVFGRGGEEIERLNEESVPWDIVPGISSALAIPAEYGIPVTYRGVSRSVHIITAHTKEDRLRQDMKEFAGLEGTLIILMGIGNLSAIVTMLLEEGKSGKTPVAVLSGGSSEHPYKITGTLEGILEKAEKQRPASPGIIVIGDAAGIDLMDPERYKAMPVVGLTGTDDFQVKLARELHSLGFQTISLMSGGCRRTGVKIPWEQLKDGRSKWLVFTSVQGVKCFFEECKKTGFDLRGFADCKFAVIGEATGEKLREFGFTADICPSVYNTDMLSQEIMAGKTHGEEVYLFCSAQGNGLKDIPCRRYDIYETVYECKKIVQERLDMIAFGSAGSVAALKESGVEIPGETEVVCIGPVCRKAFLDHYGRDPYVAEEAAVSAIAGMIVKLWERKEKDGE